MMSPDAYPPPSKAAYVLARLRADIASGKLPPGRFLAQTELAAKYGVSATPVREALRSLEAEGAVSYSQNKGATVAELTTESITDHYYLRAEVESLAVRLTVERRGDQMLPTARKLNAELRRGLGVLTPSRLSEINREFHGLLCAGGSPVITDLIGSLGRMLPQRHRIWASEAHVLDVVEQHDGILEAIAVADGATAAELMRGHILHAFETGLHSEEAEIGTLLQP